MKSLAAVLALLLAAGEAPAGGPIVDEVDPFIGTGGHGHTFPGAAWPFGMVQLSPDTRLSGWDGCSGYHASDTRVFGFSHTHLSGTGASDLGDILLMPRTGELRLDNGADGGPGYASPFEKASERAAPGWYAVTLQDTGIGVELSVTPRVGIHRYAFPEGGEAHVLIDLVHRDEVLDSALRLVGDHEVEGFRRSRHWAQDQAVHFVARFSRPFVRSGIASHGVPDPAAREAQGRDLKAWVGFDMAPGEVLLVKLGLSGVDVAGARANLDAEAPGWDFGAYREAAAAAWERELSCIEIEGGSAEQRRTFYTALYHAFLQPCLFADVDGRYRGMDLQVHRAEGWQPHTVFSLWDTFRAAYPLYTLVQPRRTLDFIRTFLDMYERRGELPVWELWANETWCMIGYHAVPVIADAWLKGLRGFDGQLALRAMRASAESRGRGLPEYAQLGFVPAEAEGESVSKTLEYGYDDWCIARMAESLGERDLAERYDRRAQGWRHLFDPSTGFLRARLHGLWFEPFVPNEVNFNYTEANAWQYAFCVPQDVDGLIELLGGREAFVRRLDALFAADTGLAGTQQADITGLIGQYAHGNEPSHHMAYLYAFAGRPGETARRVRQILDTLYAPTPDGLCGNEDCGQMSAWYVLSALGFYPVTPGRNEYVIGTALFPRATLHLDGGRDFTIRATGGPPATPCVRAATLDGRPLERSVLRHEELAAGGELVLELGAEPSPTWGVGPGREPRASIAPRILQVPFVAQGARSFSGSTSVALGSVDPGATIRCTTDGSEVGPGSPVYAGPFTLRQTTTVRWRASQAGCADTAEASATFHLAPEGLDIALASSFTPRYAAGGPRALIDGLRGGPNYRTGAWQGYWAQDLDATVDLGHPRQVSRVSLGCLQDPGAWIFMPARVEVYASTDGSLFEKLGEATPDVPEGAGATRDIAVSFPPREARWVRVLAVNHGRCPPGHPGEGEPTHLFADEIVIE